MSPETSAALQQRDFNIEIAGNEFEEVIKHLNSVGAKVPMLAVGKTNAAWKLTIDWPEVATGALI